MTEFVLAMEKLIFSIAVQCNENQLQNKSLKLIKQKNRRKRHTWKWKND